MRAGTVAIQLQSPQVRIDIDAVSRLVEQGLAGRRQIKAK